MYKRKSRLSTTPLHVTTSTAKSQPGNENARDHNNLPSQLSVQASQKRKEVEDNIGSKSFKRNKPSTFGSYFEEVVTEAGYIFQQGGSPHLLSTFNNTQWEN